MPLRILFYDALKDQPADERPLKMLSATIMSDILQAFATEANSGALNAKAAPDKPTTDAASAAWTFSAPDKPTVAALGVALPAAAAPEKPTIAATGVALPAAATPGEPQLNTEDRATLKQRFNTDSLFRAEVIAAQKLLSRSVGSIMKIDEICSKPGAMPLRVLFADALRAQEDDMLSAQLMLEILQELAVEADVAAACIEPMAGAFSGGSSKFGRLMTSRRGPDR